MDKPEEYHEHYDDLAPTKGVGRALLVMLLIWVVLGVGLAALNSVGCN